MVKDGIGCIGVSGEGVWCVGSGGDDRCDNVKAVYSSSRVSVVSVMVLFRVSLFVPVSTL